MSLIFSLTTVAWVTDGAGVALQVGLGDVLEPSVVLVRTVYVHPVWPSMHSEQMPNFLSNFVSAPLTDTAIGEGGVDIDVVLSEEQLAAFETSMACDGYGSIDRALAGIRSQDATATRPADLEAIRSLILETAGGFEQLNATVRHHLARWFERHGAVRTSVRRLTFQRTKADSLKDQSPYIEQLRSDSASRSLSGISEVPTEGDAPDGKVAASASQCVEVALAFETHI